MASTDAPRRFCAIAEWHAAKQASFGGTQRAARYTGAAFFARSSRTTRMRTMRLKGLCASPSSLSLGGCDRGAGRAGRNRQIESVESRARRALAVSARARHERRHASVIVYAPQIRTWDNFEHFTAQVAVEFLAERRETRATASSTFRATRSSIAKARLVKVPKPKVDRVTFSGGKGSEEHEDRIRAAVESEPLEIPLDVFLYYLADGVLESPPPAGFNDDAAADLRRRIAGVPALHQRRAVRDAGRRHRPRDDREREFPGVSRHEEPERTTC